MATAASTSPTANAASNLPRKAAIRALGALSSIVSSRWMITGACRRVPLRRKLARVLRRWQARDAASIRGQVRRRYGDGGSIAAALPYRNWLPSLQSFNQRASLRQDNARKSKENSLHFLGFLWPNQDFSMGYSEKKIKKLPPAELAS